MVPSTRRTFAPALLLVAISGLALAPTIIARPPPQPICEVCSDDVIDGGAVTNSQVTITIDGDGVGHWDANVTLTANASVDPDRVRGAATRALGGHRSGAAPRNLSVAITDRTVRFSYAVPGMARDVGGVRIVDYFYAGGDAGRWFGVNADRIVVRAADGATLVHAPSRFETNDTALVLEGAYGDPFAQTFDPDWQLVFADSDGPVTQVAATVGTGATVATAALADVPALAGPATLVIALALLAARWRSMNATGPRRRRLAAAGAIALGLVAAALLAVAAVLEGGPGDRLVGAGVSLVLSGVVLWWSPALGAAGALSTLLFRPRGHGSGSLPGRFGTKALALAALLVAGAPLAAASGGLVGAAYAMVTAFAAGTLFVSLRDLRGWRRGAVAVTVLLTPTLIVLGAGPHTTTFVHETALYLPWALALGFAGVLVAALDARPTAA